jgi:hypothetical protein
VRWQDRENRFESGGVVGGRGQARDFGLSALTSVDLPLADGSYGNFRRPREADGSYSNFRRLALADENSLIYVGFSSSRQKL